MFKIVEFQSEDAILRGRLYSCADVSEKLPVVIMAHGFSATINGMVADKYAEAFCKAGFAVLLYDHRNFGISGGKPRQEINKWVQARGYRDAINFVMTLPEIDALKIAVWGTSLSAAEAFAVGAMDSRVKAIIAQVPGFADQLPPEDLDGASFSSIRETFLNGDLDAIPEETTEPLPVVSFDQKGTPSALLVLTAFRWFIEYGGRYGTGWENSVSIVSKDTPVPLEVAFCAPQIKAPLLMVVAHNDEMEGASSDIARKVFDMAPQPKELIEVDGGHFGLMHYPSALFDQSSKAQIDFLTRYLKQ
ncbi:MAG: alpha/beta fold hydrolase [Deltaproteobacteria bacterium]|nr:alpha/beta fold hydrolase [Deltaproteobacteria bacterium]